MNIITHVNDNINLIEPESGQRFGTDALLLAAFAKPAPKDKALEIGAGSGIISLLCAGRNKFLKIDALEIQPELADLCRQNIINNNFNNKITAICADAREYCLRPENAGSYDIIISNPPYMRDGSGFNSSDSGRDAARRELNGDIFELCSAAAKLLRWGGILYIIYRPDRLIDLICALRDVCLEPKKLIIICDEINSQPCLILAEAKRGAKPALVMPPPFIIKSKEIEYILENGIFPDIK